MDAPDPALTREITYLRSRVESAERVVTVARALAPFLTVDEARPLVYAIEAHADFLGLRPDPAPRQLRRLASAQRRERLIAAGPEGAGS